MKTLNATKLHLKSFYYILPLINNDNKKKNRTKYFSAYKRQHGNFFAVPVFSWIIQNRITT